MTHSPWINEPHAPSVGQVPDLDLRTAFGLVVRRARCEMGLSQEDFASTAGLDRTYVSSLERGKRNPTLTTQLRLAEALGVRLSRLLAEAEEMQR